MNRYEFMKELDRLLQNIPESERREALSYYEEYFEDAGVDNEQEVIKELESPQKVAGIIKEELRGNVEFRQVPPNGGFRQNAYQQNNYQQPVQPAKKEGLEWWAILLIVIACIIASPAIIGGVAAIFGLVFGIIMTIIGLILGFGIAAIALIFTGLVLIFVGFAKLLVMPIGSIGLIGGGLLVLVFGILFMMFTVWLCGFALPWIIKGIIWLCKKPFEKKEQSQMAGGNVQ